MKRRLSFASPFVLVAACHTGPNHTINPPQPHPHYAEWNVYNNGESCLAEDPHANDACPPDASCNPPPPMTITCPEGLKAEGDPVTVYQQDDENGPCFVESTGAAIDCPSWGNE